MITKNGETQKIYLDRGEACNKELIYTIVEEMPTYKGGLKQLEADLNTALSFDKKVKEEIYFKCTINCRGEVFGFQDIGSNENETSLKIQNELLELQNWEAGKHRGVQVDCFYTLVMKIKKGEIKMSR